MGAFFGVVFASVEIGLLIAVSTKDSVILLCSKIILILVSDWLLVLILLLLLHVVAGFYIICKDPIASHKAPNGYSREDP